ncbi:hypothetical protein RSOL_513240 [Rhizoctonia solani AG-3 Rhs1AP]|uniref:Uncharacterized protein n=1 Tax=Rhizoctonia solani AG-3 Rhs1AP TaxID=1086054 RepID=X8JL08_9AGAM|nr:hypothetical protein RSOL_513240 [Rhizoctonia solani AG-3 Rhs1AP]
MVTSNPQMY